MRAFWTGDIVFGMVTIPVKLYSATKDLAPKFNQLHTICGTRINLIRRCASCAVDVPWEEIGKGYEIGDGKYAFFTKEELAEMDGGEETKGSIEIVQFVDPNEVDSAYFEKSYWIAPGGKSPKSARGFELLRMVLADTGRAALVKIKLRTKPRLGLLRARDGFFAIETMRYPEEIVSSETLARPDVKNITEREREMAEKLVDELTSAFDPTKLIDTYRASVEEAADAKAAAGDIVDGAGDGVPSAAKGPGIASVGVVDLAELLMRSLEKKKSAS